MCSLFFCSVFLLLFCFDSVWFYVGFFLFLFFVVVVVGCFFVCFGCLVSVFIFFKSVDSCSTEHHVMFEKVMLQT